MLGLQYTKRFMDHWREFRPQNYQQMKADGFLNEFIQKHSQQAADEVAALMSKGLPQHQAEEMVLPEYLWPPERGGARAVGGTGRSQR